LDALFQRVQEDIANNVRFEVDPSSIIAGPQTVTIIRVAERPLPPKETKAGAKPKTLFAAVFSVLTSEGVALDSAYDVVFEPGKVSSYSRRILGFIIASCGISEPSSDPACLKGAKAHVRLALKAFPGGGSGWVISNWGIPQPDGTYLWLFDPAREAQELARHSAGSKTAPSARLKSLIDTPAVPPPENEAPKAEENEAPKAGETEPMSDVSMDYTGNLDDVLGQLVS
jgi:hypothetical protein